MQRARWEYLLNQLYDKTITPAEEEELTQALLLDTSDAPVEEILETLMNKHVATDSLAPAAKEELYTQIKQQRPAGIIRTTPRLQRWWWTAAAMLLLVAGSTVWLTRHHTPARIIQHIDVAPGTSKAQLTLADGTQIPLDSNGRQLILQGNTSISQQNGELRYQNNQDNGPVAYNTLTTPKGGQFKLILPDNSVVWLNAASSIRYPTAFNSTERTVTITGEAFFEIAQQATQPFRVNLPYGTSLLVLGTSFNVNTYEDESQIQTTLVSGKLQVTQGSEKSILTPGQQASIDHTSNINITTLPPAAVSQAIAWKNGIFNFEQMDLQAVMRQVARWYNVEVIYKNKVPKRTFGGELSRNLLLSEILEVMHLMKVNATIEEGNKLVVQ